MTAPEDWLPRASRQEDHPLQPATIYLSWLIVLDAKNARKAAMRLRLPGWITDQLKMAIELWQQRADLSGMSPSQIVALLDPIPYLALLVCYHLTESGEIKTSISTYFTRWQKVQPKTSGNDLRQRGLAPGPHYRLVLAALRAAWLDGQISTPEEEQALLAELLAELPADD